MRCWYGRWSGVPSSTPAESFYVVPTEGGMASSSEIIQRTARDVSNRHKRQLSNISEDNDDFVDARETVPSPSTAEFSAPGTAAHSRRGSARPGPARHLGTSWSPSPSLYAGSDVFGTLLSLQVTEPS